MEIINMFGEELENDFKKFAVLPMASVEYHGPYAPLGTDYFLAEYFSKYLSKTYDCIAYPTLPYTSVPGKTNSYCGTVGVRPEIMVAYCCDILNSISKTGFKRILILNSHDGNISTSRASAEYISGIFDNLDIVIINWWQLVSSDWTNKNCSFSDDAFGHGGAYEISAMMASSSLKKNMGNDEKLQPVKLSIETPHVRIESCPKNWNGYIGNPFEANYDDGVKILKEAEKNLSKLIDNWLNKS